MKIEERELARLQTDIQIVLAICLGLFALAGAFVIAYAQTLNELFYVLTFAFAILVLPCTIGVLMIRKKMEEPKSCNLSS